MDGETEFIFVTLCFFSLNSRSSTSRMTPWP